MRTNHRFEENEQDSLKKRVIVKGSKTVKNKKCMGEGGWRGQGAELAGGSGTLASAAATWNVKYFYS